MSIATLIIAILFLKGMVAGNTLAIFAITISSLNIIEIVIKAIKKAFDEKD